MGKIRTENFLVYNLPDENDSIDIIIKDESIWLNQKGMSELFGIDRTGIGRHLKNIFDEGELDEKVVCASFAHTTEHGAIEGKTQITKIKYYNLDAIISVGYRVNSYKATKFRMWATSVLKEYMQKGFVLDDERLKQGKTLYKEDYFKELLERIRSIRTSERRIWQQITDIFAECSIDYNKNSKITKDFYAMVQNKFHYAITGKTAAEIIEASADHTKENMGLKTWKNSPDGRILKGDVIVAKNYLSEKEIRKLERAVSGFFDYLEDLIEDENTFTMEEFAESVNHFLTFRRYKILPDKGSISKKNADEKAKAEYDEFNKFQNLISDFDKELIKSTGSEDDYEKKDNLLKDETME